MQLPRDAAARGASHACAHDHAHARAHACSHACAVIRCSNLCSIWWPSHVLLVCFQVPSYHLPEPLLR